MFTVTQDVNFLHHHLILCNSVLFITLSHILSVLYSSLRVTDQVSYKNIKLQFFILESVGSETERGHQTSVCSQFRVSNDNCDLTPAVC
jgi:hypothetical protein